MPTLTGSGGCGETRLALQVAADPLPLHTDGTWYLELAPLGDDDAIEYFIIVHRSVGPKYASADADGRAPVGYAVRRLGRAGFFAAYIAVVFGALSLLDRYGSPTSYTVVILTLGAMHVFYDGFIWKRPAADRGGMLSALRPTLRP